MVQILVFYDFDGEEYLFDNFMFKVESSSDSDTIMTELLDREIVIYLDTKNLIYKTYLKELKPDSLEIDNSGIKSLKNKSDFGSEYDKWYLYSKSKIIPKSPEEFSTSEQYFFFDLIRLDKYPVCNSTQWAPRFLDNKMSEKFGSINKVTLIFFFFNFLIKFFKKCLFLFKFNPPSVVISDLFSGTKQINSGLYFKAIVSISFVGAISIFKGICNFFLIFFKSMSLICLLSSLK